MRTITQTITCLLLVSTVLTACTPDKATTVRQQALETYADIAYASYADSLRSAQQLQTALQAFVATPTADTHLAAKTAWIVVHEPYLQTEVFRFSGGPIDDADGPEPLINACPLDEAYIDYVNVDPSQTVAVTAGQLAEVGLPGAFIPVGIINDLATYPAISTELLASLNEVGGEKNISNGFHAIEFLLWGQDFYDQSAGKHSHTDYLAAEPGTSLQQIFSGLAILSKAELAGQRIFTAYDNQDQEDEHSYFSDNTHRDSIQDVQGIVNVLEGRYTQLDGTTLEGTGMLAVMALGKPQASDEIQQLFAQAFSQANQLPVPFDQTILNPYARPAVLELVYTLQDGGDQIVAVGAELGYTINNTLP
jgi:putative iron-regulated protein